MVFEIKDTVKVDESVMPIPARFRKRPELIIGNDYYYSFGLHRACPCKLVSIDETLNMVVVESIRIRGKKESILQHQLYWDEIGVTPIINTVIF